MPWPQVLGEDKAHCGSPQCALPPAPTFLDRRKRPARAAGHRADFERERERCDTLVVEALKLGTLAMSAREKAARLDGELSAARARRRWWRRLIAPRCGANAAPAPRKR